MARDKGTYNMPGNIELRKEAPLDARRKVNTFAELFLEDTWKDSNNRVWLYDGMTVEVGDRLGELWQLKNKTSYSNPEDWIRISGGIEDAPKDGTPYMRQDGKWKGYTQIGEVYTFVEVVENNKITQEAYDGLKAAIEAGKIIAYTQPGMTQYLIASSASVMDGTINLIFSFLDDVNSITINSDLTYNTDILSLLAEDNTSAYQVTDDYNPAHKKYVDDTNFGKVINGTTEIYNTFNLTGSEAEAKISNLFNSIDAFKQCVKDIQNNHTRYFYTDGSNYIEINAATHILKEDIFELYFIYRHPSPLNLTLKLVSFKIDATNNENSIAIIQSISTDDKLKTMFADITADMYQNINNISGYGIASIQNDADATTERNYPINESGTLFYGKAPYGSVNEIFGSYLSNRWFARGGGRGSSQMTSWKEYLFKEDMSTYLPPNSNLNDFKTFGVYSQSSTGALESITNRPTGDTGEAVLQVYECGPNYAIQIYYNITAEQASIRHYHNGTWGYWHLYTGIEQNYVESGSIDNITAAGEYVIGPDVTNDPFTDYCWLKIMGSSDIVQIVIRFNTLEIAIRSKINGNWSSWKYVTTSDNLSIITKVTTAQYNASSKASNTAYFVTD